MSSMSAPRRSARLAAKATLQPTKATLQPTKATLQPTKAVAPVTPVTPGAPVDPFKGLTEEQRVRAERIHKKALEREALRWHYYGPLRDAVNDVRDKLNLLFEPGSKEWYIAFDAHPAVQEWQGSFFEIMNVSSGW